MFSRTPRSNGSFKALSLALAWLFFLPCPCFASADAGRDNLQVKLLFDEGWHLDKEIRFEVASVVSVILKYKNVPWHDLNGIIAKWYARTGRPFRGKIEVRNCVIDTRNNNIALTLRYRPDETMSGVFEMNIPMDLRFDQIEDIGDLVEKQIKSNAFFTAGGAQGEKTRQAGSFSRKGPYATAKDRFFVETYTGDAIETAMKEWYATGDRRIQEELFKAECRKDMENAHLVCLRDEKGKILAICVSFLGDLNFYGINREIFHIGLLERDTGSRGGGFGSIALSEALKYCKIRYAERGLKEKDPVPGFNYADKEMSEYLLSRGVDLNDQFAVLVSSDSAVEFYRAQGFKMIPNFKRDQDMEEGVYSEEDEEDIPNFMIISKEKAFGLILRNESAAGGTYREGQVETEYGVEPGTGQGLLFKPENAAEAEEIARKEEERMAARIKENLLKRARAARVAGSGVIDNAAVKALFAGNGARDGGRKVDIVIPAALIEGTELERYTETLAYLALVYADLENLNFIIEESVTLGGRKLDTVASFKNGVAVAGDIKRKIREKAAVFGVAPDKAERLISERVKSERTEARQEGGKALAPIEVVLLSRDALDREKETVPPKDNEYVVAVLAAAPKGKTGTIMNLDAAFTVAVCEAALVMLKSAERDETAGIVKERIKKTLNRILSRFLKKKVRIEDSTLDYLVSDIPSVRVTMALEFALPPITRAPLKLLSECHQIMQSVLMSA